MLVYKELMQSLSKGPFRISLQSSYDLQNRGNGHILPCVRVAAKREEDAGKIENSRASRWSRECLDSNLVESGSCL